MFNKAKNSLKFIIMIFLLFIITCENDGINEYTGKCTFLDLIPREGLVAAFTFDGNAVEIQGMGYDGTVCGPVITEDRFGNEEAAYLFDGVDDYIDINNPGALQIPFPISIAMWVRVDQVGSSTAPFTNSYVDSINTGVWLAFSSDRGRVGINFGDGSTIGRDSRKTKLGETPIEESQWYHIAGVIQDAENMTVYLNGVDDKGETTGNGTDHLEYGNGPATLGRRYTGLNQPPVFYEGAIDEMVIYNRALTADEVRMLCMAGYIIDK